MNENFSIQVNKAFLDSLYGLADSPAPAEPTLDDLNEIVTKIREKMSNMALSMSSAAAPPPAAPPQSTPQAAPTPAAAQNTFMQGGVNEGRPRTILIIDDLGVITYQLEILFKKVGFDVVVSNEINDAIEKYKTKDFGYVVMDLFIPTEREGFMLLDELKKLSLLCKLNTKIVVMTASSKPEYKSNCLNRGADNYVEKVQGWQQELVKACAP